MVKDYSEKKIRVSITTIDQYIDGALVVPANIRNENSTDQDTLFYTLNSGYQFLTLYNCAVREKNNIMFRPEIIATLNIRVTAIVTMQITTPEQIEEELRRKERKVE